MIFVIIFFITKGICHAVIAVTFTVLILVNQASELRFLCHIVGILLGVIVDAVRLHKIFGKQAPVAVFALPDFALPSGDRERAVGLMAETKYSNRALWQIDGLQRVPLRLALLCSLGKEQVIEG